MNEQETELLDEMEECIDEMIRDPLSLMAHVYSSRCVEILNTIPKVTASKEALERVNALMQRFNQSLED